MTSTFQSLPRPKPRSLSDGSFESMLLVFCVVWTVGSLVMLMLCAFTLGPDWYRYWQLQHSGVVTSGQMIRQDPGKLWASHIFQFTTDDLAVHTGQHAIPSAQFQPIAPGETVLVRYVAHNPEIAVLESYFTTPFMPRLWFVGLGGVMLGLGLALLPARWRAWRSVRRLYTQGYIAPATVVNLWRSTNVRHQVLYCIAYEFEATRPNGQIQTILSAEYNELAFETLRLRQQTPVRYLPENPEICRLEVEPIIEARIKKINVPSP
ncbi:MAG TPA: hypothetical protein P5526_13640 [Anaerolineae bacterium]|mgnify:CR=1 FL=1|nr:hypothetical protein [Anaerolineae bacterium]MCB0225608.1 hypothetical protein [Anaerolineae bacterium]HRV93199.1 hypothetical protein [Anaerolineae bacterium]